MTNINTTKYLISSSECIDTDKIIDNKIIVNYKLMFNKGTFLNTDCNNHCAKECINDIIIQKSIEKGIKVYMDNYKGRIIPVEDVYKYVSKDTILKGLQSYADKQYIYNLHKRLNRKEIILQPDREKYIAQSLKRRKRDKFGIASYGLIRSTGCDIIVFTKEEQELSIKEKINNDISRYLIDLGIEYIYILTDMGYTPEYYVTKFSKDDIMVYDINSNTQIRYDVCWAIENKDKLLKDTIQSLPGNKVKIVTLSSERVYSQYDIEHLMQEYKDKQSKNNRRNAKIRLGNNSNMELRIDCQGRIIKLKGYTKEERNKRIINIPEFDNINSIGNNAIELVDVHSDYYNIINIGKNIKKISKRFIKANYWHNIDIHYKGYSKNVINTLIEWVNNIKSLKYESYGSDMQLNIYLYDVRSLNQIVYLDTKGLKSINSATQAQIKIHYMDNCFRNLQFSSQDVIDLFNNRPQLDVSYTLKKYIELLHNNRYRDIMKNQMINKEISIITASLPREIKLERVGYALWEGCDFQEQSPDSWIKIKFWERIYELLTAELMRRNEYCNIEPYYIEFKEYLTNQYKTVYELEEYLIDYIMNINTRDIIERVIIDKSLFDINSDYEDIKLYDNTILFMEVTLPNTIVNNIKRYNIDISPQTGCYTIRGLYGDVSMNYFNRYNALYFSSSTNIRNLSSAFRLKELNEVLDKVTIKALSTDEFTVKRNGITYKIELGNVKNDTE